MMPGTFLSTRQIPVFCAVIPLMQGSTVNEISLIYGPGGKGKECWWPDTPCCQAQIEQVFQWFTHDMDSLGDPIKVLSAERAAVLAARLAQYRAARIKPEAPGAGELSPNAPSDYLGDTSGHPEASQDLTGALD